MKLKALSEHLHLLLKSLYDCKLKSYTVGDH